MAPPKTEISEIIGFDLGHGETALARIDLAEGDKCKLLPINNLYSQVTAFARLPSGEVELGEKAAQTEASEPIDIAFKSKPALPTLPPDHPDAQRWQLDRENLKTFASACYKAVRPYIRGGEACQVVVGCPSGWVAEEVQQYQQVFEEAGLPHVQVVQESRAAFISARESESLRREQLQDAILLIDVGSSTTDLTYIKGLHIREEPVGHQLGAGLIDEHLLAINLAGQPDVAQYFKVFPEARKKCLLLCRSAKESYFNGVLRGSPGLDLTSTLEFRARVNDAIMEQCLYDPLKDLDGRSWADTYRGLLQAMRGKLELAAHRDNLHLAAVLPRHILLTGGASRMPLTQQICREVFPEAGPPLPEAEPQFCVAKGLAEFARWQHRVDRFRAEVQAFYELDSLKQLLRPYVMDFGVGFLREAVEELFEKVIRACINTWRQAQSRPQESILLDFQDRLRAWVQTESIPLKRKAFSTVSSALEGQLAHKANAVFERNKVPQKKVQFQIDPQPFDLSEAQKDAMNNVFVRACDWLIQRAVYAVPDAVVDATIWGFKKGVPGLYYSDGRLSGICREACARPG
jgi:molecular chaperone DnaK (HSP70)